VECIKKKYVKTLAPDSGDLNLLIHMFNVCKLLMLQFARQYSRNEALTLDWLCRNIGWPFAPPKTIIDLVHLEAVFDVLDLYLWFRYDGV
jgi:ATP-dependent RNA helicase SUPV3L1/SUV3